MSGRTLKIIGPVAGCAFLACLPLATSPMSGGLARQPLCPQAETGSPVDPSGTPGTRAGQVHGSQTSRMMAVMPWSDFTAFGDPPGPNLLQLYQVPPGDCGHPVLVGTYDFGPIIPHEFQIWHDKIYVTNFGGSPGPSSWSSTRRTWRTPRC